MSFQIIDNEAVTEPVTLSEAKAYMQVDADYASDDAIIEIAITAARIMLEQYLNVAFVQRAIQVVWNGTELKLPLVPTGAVTGVVKNDEADPLPADDYTVSGYPNKTIYINSLCPNNYDYFYNLNGSVEISLTEGIHNNDYYTVSYSAGYLVLPGLLKQALLAQIDQIYKLRGLPEANVISSNARQLASGYSNNLIIQ